MEGLQIVAQDEQQERLVRHRCAAHRVQWSFESGWGQRRVGHQTIANLKGAGRGGTNDKTSLPPQ